MGRIEIESAALRRAAVICLIGFGINALSNPSGCSPFAIRLGDILLFMTAASFGPMGAFVAIFCGSIPCALTVDNAHYAIQSAILLLATGYGARYAPKIPSYVLVIFAWCLIVGPMLRTFPPIPGTAPAWYEEAQIFA